MPAYSRSRTQILILTPRNYFLLSFYIDSFDILVYYLTVWANEGMHQMSNLRLLE